ncbi:MAG TPA: Ig-like domain-containing protein [Gaiellaceae bacterium]|jgi:hypothetical protein|nr:Ig-like domain-containing protein [Gaiellaceae bacterium]
MELLHPIADGIALPARSTSRIVRLTFLVLLSASVMAAFGAHAALAADPSVVLTLSGSAVAADAPVTMTATVTSAVGSPTGTISFIDAGSPAVPLYQGPLVPAAGSLSVTAQFTTSALSSKTYSIYAEYVPDLPALLGGLAKVDSSAQTLAVGTVPPTLRPTQVILGAPSEITSTELVTLTATVTEVPPGGIPTGTVQFVDMISGSPIRLGPGDVTLDSHGVAQIAVSLSPGPHQIVASYSGGGIESPSSSLPTVVTSHPPVDVTVTTNTTVHLSPSPIAAGDTVTITATVVQTGPGAPAQPTGRVTFSSYSMYGDDVWIGEADLGTAPDGLSAAANQAIIQVNTLRAAEYSIIASYRGDLYDKSSGATIPLSVLPPRPGTAIHYTGDTTAEFGHLAVLSATITDLAHTPLAGRVVTFTLGTQSCTATVGPDGGTSCSLTVTQHPGDMTVSVNVPQDVTTQAASVDRPFALAPQPTSISAVARPGVGATTLTATLLGDTGPLDNQPVTLSLDAASCAATTNAAGVGTCLVPPITGPLTATLAASYGGTADYLPSASSDTVQLVLPTTLSTVATYTGATSGEYHDLVLLSGTLADSTGAPLGGQPVTLAIGAQTCTTTTSSAGKAACLVVLTQPSGSYSASLSYTGNVNYLATTASAPFTISREQTTLVAKVGEAVIDGNAISLSAMLLEDSVFPIENRTVTLKLGTASCTATTGVLGYATCTVPRAASLGSSTFAATFAGDTYYLPSSATRSTIVCAFPSGGSFVIGDRESGSVTFWGSQWSRQNQLSRGDAPSSFKGWTPGAFDSSWSGDWSTDTGSSGSQPSGTLPTYMAVIQTSSSRKSGSRISGDTVHIVVVKTNAGYAPNAGHDGTGTIVATVR